MREATETRGVGRYHAAANLSALLAPDDSSDVECLAFTDELLLRRMMRDRLGVDPDDGDACLAATARLIADAALMDGSRCGATVSVFTRNRALRRTCHALGVPVVPAAM
jgi:hypothetical protein